MAGAGRTVGRGATVARATHQRPAHGEQSISAQRRNVCVRSAERWRGNCHATRASLGACRLTASAQLRVEGLPTLRLAGTIVEGVVEAGKGLPADLRRAVGCSAVAEISAPPGIEPVTT